MCINCYHETNTIICRWCNPMCECCGDATNNPQYLDTEQLCPQCFINKTMELKRLYKCNQCGYLSKKNHAEEFQHGNSEFHISKIR